MDSNFLQVGDVHCLVCHKTFASGHLECEHDPRVITMCEDTCPEWVRSFRNTANEHPKT